MPKLPRQWTSSPVDMATNKKRVAYFYDGERPSRGTLHAHGRCRVPVGAPCACSARDSRPGVGQRFGAPFFSRREGGLGQGSRSGGWASPATARETCVLCMHCHSGRRVSFPCLPVSIGHALSSLRRWLPSRKPFDLRRLGGWPRPRSDPAENGCAESCLCWGSSCAPRSAWPAWD